MNLIVREFELHDGARIVVIGGGPAGAFFAIQFLKQAGYYHQKAEIVIIDKKIDLKAHETAPHFSCKEGCNYCAGGISPKLAAALENEKLIPTDEIIADDIKSLTIHGHWKNIELRVPDHKKMYSVFRGSRPKGKVNKSKNFDSFLLEKAKEAGAKVIFGEVFHVKYKADQKIVVLYRFSRSKHDVHKAIQADFVVFAAGVNQNPEELPEKQPIIQTIQTIIPGFQPPKVRKALISEIEIIKDFEGFLQGEIYFMEYGSKELKIEMSSLLPKKKYITVVMLGRSIDRAQSTDKVQLLRKYLQLPQVKRIFPQGVEKTFACACNPNMTVGAAKNPVGNRTAVIGDLAVSRLYKDGIYSAYLMASSLTHTILKTGISRKSLKRGYWSTIKKIKFDNSFGKLVFLLNRVVFSNPVLGRILYQAVLTERKNKPKRSRRLADILWKIASGDDTYKNSFMSMLHPIAISSILVGGLLVTIRNYLTERVFGLKWQNFGRYPTGLHKEDFEEKKKEFNQVVFANPSHFCSEFESMYSITIKSSRRKIFKYLGTFGDEDRKYFRPRMIKVKRISGIPNHKGCELRYRTPLKFLDFDLALENVIDESHLIFKVKRGFAKDGILVFNLKKMNDRVFVLYIYVAFNFVKGKKRPEKIGMSLLRFLFPGFIHDVLWNHSLCQLKDAVETEQSA
jgi:flavin-dependent dehydrogenase